MLGFRVKFLRLRVGLGLRLGPTNLQMMNTQYRTTPKPCCISHVFEGVQIFHNCCWLREGDEFFCCCIEGGLNSHR